MSGETIWTRAVADADLAVGARQALRLHGRPVLLLRTDNALHAIEDRCPHAMQPLNDGRLEAGVLHCARHGAAFELCSGKPLNGVSKRPLVYFPTRISDGWIEVELPKPAPSPFAFRTPTQT